MEEAHWVFTVLWGFYMCRLNRLLETVGKLRSWYQSDCVKWRKTIKFIARKTNVLQEWTIVCSIGFPPSLERNPWSGETRTKWEGQKRLWDLEELKPWHFIMRWCRQTIMTILSGSKKYRSTSYISDAMATEDTRRTSAYLQLHTATHMRRYVYVCTCFSLQ